MKNARASSWGAADGRAQRCQRRAGHLLDHLGRSLGDGLPPRKPTLMLAPAEIAQFVGYAALLYLTGFGVGKAVAWMRKLVDVA